MKKNLKSNKSNSKLPSTKKEIGGPKGPEPTRYGDWEKKGFVTISSFFLYYLILLTTLGSLRLMYRL